MKLHPFDKCIERAQQLMEQGHSIYQQFNCAGCGAKQTMDDPNTFYESGTCERCGHLTDIRRDGCNYMVHLIPAKLQTRRR